MERREIREVRGGDLDGYVRQWRRIEGEVENRLWKLAEIADSVVGLGMHGEKVVESFAASVGCNSQRIYVLSKIWRLRVETFGRGEVMNRADGKPLTVTHFQLALNEADPERVIDESIALSLSTADLAERAAERRRERGRKAAGELVGAREPSPLIVRKTHGNSHDGEARGGLEHTCGACGGFLMQMNRLGRVADDLGMTLSQVSEEAGVSEDLVERMAEGGWVNQQMGMRVAEAMHKRLAARERKSW